MGQQERGTRSRQTILEAAARVFDERGYDAASTNDILALSGLTRGALYHHFPSKEAIAAALVAAQSEALVVPPQDVQLQAAIDLTMEFARRLQSDPVLTGQCAAHGRADVVHGAGPHPVPALGGGDPHAAERRGPAG